MSDFLEVLFDSDVIVPVAFDGGGQQSTALSPIMFHRVGRNMVAVFSSECRTTSRVMALASDCRKMKFKDLVAAVSDGVGFVMNPGHEVGFEVSSEVVKAKCKVRAEADETP